MVITRMFYHHVLDFICIWVVITFRLFIPHIFDDGIKKIQCTSKEIGKNILLQNYFKNFCEYL